MSVKRKVTVPKVSARTRRDRRAARVPNGGVFSFVLPERATGRSTVERLRANVGAMEPAVQFRRLGRTELSRVDEIDRRERIDVLYDQHGTQLVARRGNWSASAWEPDCLLYTSDAADE